MSGAAGLRRVGRHLPMVGWLWLLWIMLWGSLGPRVLVGGAVVAVVVVAVFPLPAVPGWLPRPLAGVRLLVRLLADLVGSGVVVAWQAVRHGPRTSAAIVEVPLRADDDLLITAVAEVATMSPGTLVMEIDRRRRRLYVHALPVRDARGVELRREEVRSVERTVARAMGRSDGTRDSGGNRR
ncbi:Na+/H+ antiporter subunit E [Streptomyces sp. B93]|uniref:Na+/H+ antiporter subunit E n=1 Tax=Streptomyces sp. B93 TaxID=2824875 RepID=UPI001B3637A3|nr:Na+/H+ antiporter subunit E [Streptomyces sp. B93]MBQ1088650.1 Na+/H+ antiporter subunit E [Streptomyces sp. B93]